MQDSTVAPHLTPPRFDADHNWLRDLRLDPAVRGALKAAAQEQVPRDFVHALVARAPYSSRLPKPLRKAGSGGLLTLARPAVEVLEGEANGPAAAFLASLTEAAALPRRQQRSETARLVREWAASPEAFEPAGLFMSFVALVAFGSSLPSRIVLPLWGRTGEEGLPLIESSASDEAIASLGEFLSRVELPWWFATTHWPIVGASAFSASFDEQLAGQLDRLTDETGAPHAQVFHELPAILASLVRCLVLDQLRESAVLSQQTRNRISQLVVRTTGLLNDAGQLPGNDSKETVSLLRTASRLLDLSRSTDTRTVLRWLETAGESERLPSPSKTTARALRRLRSSHSEWAHSASLAAQRETFSSHAVVAFHRPAPGLTLGIDGRPLFDGAWEARIRLGTEWLRSPAEWTCSCWYSDSEADFAELQALVRPGVSLHRHAMIAKRRPWLLLADEVRAFDTEIEYSASLPLSEGWTVASDGATREWALFQQDTRLRVCPVYLPQEKATPTTGRFSIQDGQLHVAARGRGGLYLPVIYEWDAEQHEAGVDWNRLTVAENGRVMEPWEATGYRLRVGESQVVAYHTQTRAYVGRSVLGHHTLYETVIGNFEKTGTLDPLIQVEFSTGGGTEATKGETEERG